MGSYDTDTSVFGRFKSHFSLQRDNTELTVVESLREVYPEKHITALPIVAADLIEFAEAGKAKACLMRDGNRYLSRRGYTAPTGRMRKSEGTLHERVQFGLYEYSFDGTDFHLFVMEWYEGDTTTIMQYVLSSKEGVEAGSPHHPVVDKLIKAAGKYSSELHEQIYVFDGGFWRKNHKLWESVQSSSWEDVILDPAMKDTLIKDVEGFFDSRKIYEEYAVPWKRGIIFHGTPGCGKTISLKALMNSLQKRDVASLYVKSFKACQGAEYSIRSIFAQARLMAPCMLIFEDLDSLVVDEVRSYFLNELDGLEDNNGMLVIGSTNHLGRLDPAIAKRPSRFDRKYHYKLPGNRERMLYCQYWRGKLLKSGKIDFPEEICDVVAQITDGFSFAYLKELFVQALLSIVSGRADSPDDENDGYIEVTDAAAKDTKIIDDSARLANEGESNQSTVDKTDDKAEEKKKVPKPQMPEVEIPKHLESHSLMHILHKQTKALWREMDNTDDDEIHGRMKID